MAVDVLVLNTAVADFRRSDFKFVDELVGKGGLAKCPTKQMPDYSQEQLAQWIEKGFATAGGPGNTAPLMAKAGLEVAVGANFGAGKFGGLDAQGRFFCDVMVAHGVDISEICVHPDLPTGTTFIQDKPGEDRGGIAYFANANDDFDFSRFKMVVERLKPGIVYYMYSGLSERGDANSGKDLAEFVGWCRSKGAITIVDSHTLTANPKRLIEEGGTLEAYKLLEPLLPVVDLFFSSCDEAKLIENTLGAVRDWNKFSEHDNCVHFLDFLATRFWQGQNRTRLFGVTVTDGAYERHIGPDGNEAGPNKISSHFMGNGVIDLVGAGDSFRAGIVTYIACNLSEFKDGSMDFAEAIQMGNLFASLYVKAPLQDRYSGIRSYDKMLQCVREENQ